MAQGFKITTLNSLFLQQKSSLPTVLRYINCFHQVRFIISYKFPSKTMKIFGVDDGLCWSTWRPTKLWHRMPWVRAIEAVLTASKNLLCDRVFIAHQVDFCKLSIFSKIIGRTYQDDCFLNYATQKYIR